MVARFVLGVPVNDIAIATAAEHLHSAAEARLGGDDEYHELPKGAMHMLATTLATELYLHNSEEGGIGVQE